MEQTCTRCQQTHPATTEFFYRRGARLRADCKKCVYARLARWRKAHPEEWAAQSKRYARRNPEKRCEHVRRYRERHPERVRQSQRAARPKQLASARARYSRGGETAKERNRLKLRQYRQKHGDQWRAYRRAYRAKNRDKLRAQARARQHIRRKQHQAWKAANPLYYHAYWNAARVRKLEIEGILTPGDILDLVQAQEGRCYYCRIDLVKGFDIDHIVPLSKSGTNKVENIALACPACNRGKGNRSSAEQWFAILRKRGVIAA